MSSQCQALNEYEFAMSSTQKNMSSHHITPRNMRSQDLALNKYEIAMSRTQKYELAMSHTQEI